MTDDQDLKKLQRASQASPAQLDLQRWKKTLQEKKKRLPGKGLQPWMQWAVAAFVGFVVGGLAFHRPSQPSMQVASISLDEDATFEHVYTKSE